MKIKVETLVIPSQINSSGNNTYSGSPNTNMFDKLENNTSILGKRKSPKLTNVSAFSLLKKKNVADVGTNKNRKKLAGMSSAPSTSNSLSASSDCVICGDRATGKHYGSISCDGCKGFFRRTIRKQHSYICRFDKNCTVDKDHRNTCRKCRFDKCLTSGMRSDAVQLERDRISATIRRPSTPLLATTTTLTTTTTTTSTTITTTTTTTTPTKQFCCKLKENSSSNENHDHCSMFVSKTMSSNVDHKHTTNILSSKNLKHAEECINKLMAAETTMRQMRASVITRTADAYRTATTGDVTDSMHQQLILMVEWAKHLDNFCCLPMPAQIGLLRHFSAQHLVICAAFRSIAVRDAVWLTNESCVPRDAPKIPDVNRVAARVLDHLTEPMRRLHLDEKEYVALKAVAFFDPIAKGAEESAIDIQKTREEVLDAFEYHVTRVSPHREMPLRLANLLLLLPPIMAIARDLVEEAQLAKLFGLANVDELMAELLLPEDAENNTYQHLKTSVTTKVEPNPLHNNNLSSDETLNKVQKNASHTEFDSKLPQFNTKNLQCSINTPQVEFIVPPAPTPSTSPISNLANFNFSQLSTPGPNLTLNTENTSEFSGKREFDSNNKNVGLYFLNSTLQQPNGFTGLSNNPTTMPLDLNLTSTISNTYFNFDASNLTNSFAMGQNRFTGQNSISHFHVPSTVSPSSSLLSLSANSPFSSSASSPGVIAGNASAAAAAAALCFCCKKNFSLNSNSNESNHVNAGSLLGVVSTAESNIIVPTPIYPAPAAVSLMSNLIRDHQNSFLKN